VQRLADGVALGERTALVVVELDGLERLRASGAVDALGQATAALDRELSGAGLVARECDVRTWAFAPRWDRVRAQALVRRLAAAVALAPAPHGAPLTVSAGLAVHPDDGRDAGSLCACAEEALLAARAEGVSVLG
jgi:GGDEF domain-containing protein